MAGNSGPLGGPTTTPLGGSRGLMMGEIQMAQLIFKNSINYHKVRVHNTEYFPFGWQTANTAVTPDGEMYFTRFDFKEDFSSSSSSADEIHWFIHEMTHVWQHQLGYWVRFRGAIRIGLDYEYTLDAQRRLSDYNMEAQGDILADYFVLKFLNNPFAVHNKLLKKPLITYSIKEYEQTLKDFLVNPANKTNLP